MNATPSPAPNPILIIARGTLVRSWWRMAILGLIFAPVLAAAAYKSARPVFTASGMIRVTPTVARVIYGNEDNQQLPFYDVYLNAQLALVGSRPVLERAVEDPELRKAGWPEGTEGIALLSRKLTVVKGGPRSELIEITVSAGHPLVCTAAVNAVLNAFERISFERQEATVTMRERAIEQRLADLDTEHATLLNALTAAAGEYGADNIERVHLARVDDLQRLDERLRGIDRNIAEQRAKLTSTAGAEETNVEVRRLVALDHTMGSLIMQRLAASTEFDRVKYRYGPSHPSFRDAAEKLRLAEEAVKARTELLATLGKTGVLATDGSKDESIDTLVELRNGIARVREDAGKSALELDRRRSEVQRLLSRRTQLQEMISETKRRRDQMYVENTAQLPGRVSIAVRGMVPVAPSQDKRKPFTAGGGLFGFLLGAALGAIPGLLRPRLTDPSEVALLGPYATIAPAIPDVVPEKQRTRRLAAHQVSLLRTILDQSHDATAPGPCVVSVVSADRGEGKTNVCLALARAFADAGRTVLLVDADLAHAGLSRALSLGERPGLRERLRANPGTESLGSDTVMLERHLSVLPAGRPDADLQISQLSLSRASLYRVVTNAGPQPADVVIFDTPSLSAAPDALAAASMADHIVLVIRQGQRLSRVRAVGDRLSRTCGGRIYGLVNRASRISDSLTPDDATSFAVDNGVALSAVRDLRPA